MAVHNGEIADMFEQLADLLEIEGANPFRIRAYRHAARTIRGHPQSMSELLGEGQDLAELPGIGADLAAKIGTIVATGRLPLLDQVQARTPAALSDLMKIEGLGAKRVRKLYRELRIRSVEDLRRAADSGKIRELQGFGKKTEHAILERIGQVSATSKRMQLITAEDFAVPLVTYLGQCAGVKAVTIAGSYRRRRDTVGDLDILVTATRESPVMTHFTSYDEVTDVISKGTTRATVRLHSGISVDLRVVPQVSFGAALIYFTGSKAHNIVLRKLAMKKGYKLNEYGLFKGDKRIAGKSEAAVYRAIGLPLIPPELRENRGEVEAARKHELPALIELADIRGDLHCHTKASDGRHTVRQMAEAAIERGYEYLSINDHSRHVTVAHGLDRKRLLRQIKAIDKLNETLGAIRILKSIELDILEDGSLDLPDSILRELDFTVCAVHYKLNLPREKQTERILRAMDNPYFNILAHPTGRLINQRQAYDVDLDRLMRASRQRGCILELNAHPDRLDLTDEACMMARDIGVKIAIATDAHTTAALDYMRFGIDQARRGWLEKNDVINTLPLKALRQVFKRQ